MLEKITNQIFVEKKMKRMIKLSKISFFIGLAVAIAFPLLAKNIKIEEKQLRNTSLYSRKIDNYKFSAYYKEYFQGNNLNDEIYNFCTQIFRNTSNIPYNKIFTKNILSPRGKKFHLIQINLIYDTINNLENTRNINFVFYALIKYLSDKNNIHWLAKDIQINYVSKELFDNNPKECYELLTNAKYNERLEQGKIIHGIYNFDLSEINFEQLNTILIKIVGINSEHVDIDFFKMVVSNFQANFNSRDFQITTHEEVLSKNAKKNILFILNFFNDIIKNFEKNAEYKIKYLYIIEDILSDYFFINNKITTNNLFITNRFNSLLIKTTGQPNYNYNSRDRKIKSYYDFLGTIIVIIKGINTEEIDLFRGLYFYILTSPYQCIEYTYLFILILMTLRGFFHLVELIYNNEYKFIWTKNNSNINNEENNNNYIYASRIISCLFFMGIVYLFALINIKKCYEILNFSDQVYNYYFLLGNIFINQIFIFMLLKLSKSEGKFINIILMYLNILNCWNFIFVNVGIGLTFAVVLMTMEFIFLNLTLVKYCVIKIGIIGAILYLFLHNKKFVETMLGNYIEFNNNIFIFVSITIILLMFRVALFIVMLMNKIERRESWNYDEIEIFEDDNEDINENNENENKAKENKENEDKEKDNIEENKIIEKIEDDNSNEQNDEDKKEENNESDDGEGNVIEFVKEESKDEDSDSDSEIKTNEIRIIKEEE